MNLVELRDRSGSLRQWGHRFRGWLWLWLWLYRSRHGVIGLGRCHRFVYSILGVHGSSLLSGFGGGVRHAVFQVHGNVQGIGGGVHCKFLV